MILLFSILLTAWTNCSLHLEKMEKRCPYDTMYNETINRILEYTQLCSCLSTLKQMREMRRQPMEPEHEIKDLIKDLLKTYILCHLIIFYFKNLL